MFKQFNFESSDFTQSNYMKAMIGTFIYLILLVILWSATNAQLYLTMANIWFYVSFGSAAFKRHYALGQTRWWTLLIILPFFNFLYIIGLAFFKDVKPKNGEPVHRGSARVAFVEDPVYSGESPTPMVHIEKLEDWDTEKAAPFKGKSASMMTYPELVKARRTTPTPTKPKKSLSPTEVIGDIASDLFDE